ncbi:ABC transporter permease subunit [Shouchella shacheensis]|uniref:ABC transporter permease subunit n=1 Tax=Shouchella shacheensis TaxID=1649580 RepID=UPI0007404567|nr:ABC transporter permease subunit [Shouchella shacheensis]
MNKRGVWTLAKKDMNAVKASVQLWLPMVLLPVLLGAALPGGVLIWVRFFDLTSIGNMEVLLRTLEAIEDPALQALFGSMPSLTHQLVYFLSMYLFAPLFLLIPVMAASVITANSFAGEKERKTLEGLLYTPLTMGELFLGKALAAFIPALLLTVASFLLYGVVVNTLAYPLFTRMIFPNGSWLLLVFLVIPALSIFIILLNILISAKVKGFQEAYQLGGLVVLPIVALVIGQAVGFLFIRPLLLLAIAFAIVVLSLIFFKLIRRFTKRHEFLEKMG